MTMLVAVALTAAAVAVLTPSSTARARWRLLRATRSQPKQPVVTRQPCPPPAGPRPAALMRPLRHARGVAVTSVAAATMAGLLGATVAGPVAGMVLAAYGGSGGFVFLRRLRQRAEGAAHRRASEAVAALAADLRAGLTVEAALARAGVAMADSVVVGGPAATVGRRVTAAVQLAQTSGAPLADVLDRLDGHLRAASRVRNMAAAQAAGARASAALLAVMPAAGVGLGFVMGVDAWSVLLHTPPGAAGLLGGVVLQLAGLAWSARLSRVAVPE